MPQSVAVKTKSEFLEEANIIVNNQLFSFLFRKC